MNGHAVAVRAFDDGTWLHGERGAGADRQITLTDDVVGQTWIDWQGGAGAKGAGQQHAVVGVCLCRCWDRDGGSRRQRRVPGRSGSRSDW